MANDHLWLREYFMSIKTNLTINNNLLEPKQEELYFYEAWKSIGASFMQVGLMSDQDFVNFNKNPDLNFLTSNIVNNYIFIFID